MIFWILELLRDGGWHPPLVFEYTSTRMVLAAITSLLFCILVGPEFIRKLYELKIGQTIRKEECPMLGKLHEKKQDTPTMGGILILSGMVLSLFLWADFDSIYPYILLLTTLFIGWMGGRDDYLKLKYKNTKGLSARWKLLYQAVFASLIAIYLLFPGVSSNVNSFVGVSSPVIKLEEKNKLYLDPSFLSKGEHKEKTLYSTIPLDEFTSRVYVPFFKDPVLLLKGGGIIIAFALILFVIVGSSNAVNLTDGLDGLASGCLIMVAASLMLVAFVSNNIDLAFYLHIPYIEGAGEIAVYLAAFSGGCLGFLWYNAHPAQVFMGDIGSLTLGAVVGVSAVLLKREVFLGVVGGIFVAEALSVILQVGSYKLRNKRRIFLCAPLHHHFEYQGIAETKVVIRFWIIALLLALVGIASLKFQ